MTLQENATTDSQLCGKFHNIIEYGGDDFKILSNITFFGIPIMMVDYNLVGFLFPILQANAHFYKIFFLLDPGS